MMIIDELISTNALLISNALLAGATAIAVLRFQRMTRQLANCQASPSAIPPPGNNQTNLQNQLVEQRILALQRIADELAQKEQKLQPKDSRVSPYENAARMVKSGADADELTRSCGLNQGEAQLMVRLHARARQKA